MWKYVLLSVALVAFAPAARADAGLVSLKLSAYLGAAGTPLQAGVHWRLYSTHAEVDGSHRQVDESTDAQPSLLEAPGDYVVHVAFGLASATKSITLGAAGLDQPLTLAAGALRIHGVLGDKTIEPQLLSLQIFVPERNNSEAKLVDAKARAGDVVGVPEGLYHISSTYLDTVGVGSLGFGKGVGGAPTNSVASGDVRVAAGKIVDVTLRHRCAKLTIKLVSARGQGALANTTFTVLTPGGDIIRELIGAYPSLVLAEGEYVVVARHEAKTYQATFQVQSGLDRDVEVIAQDESKAEP